MGIRNKIRVVSWITTIGYRFVTGRPMSGERKTDSTFWRPATRSLDPSHTALRWEMMRGAARAGWRLGGLYLVSLIPLIVSVSLLGRLVSLPWYLRAETIVWGNVSLVSVSVSLWMLRWYGREFGLPRLRFEETEAPGRRLRLRVEQGEILPRGDVSVETENGDGETGDGETGTVSPGPWRIVGHGDRVLRLRWEETETSRRLRLVRDGGMRDWRREKVVPLARSVSVILGQHIPKGDEGKWVRVSPDYREGGDVSVRLPQHFPGDEGVKKRLRAAVSQKLGVSPISASWEMEGSSPRVRFSVPASPPEFLDMGDVEAWLSETAEYRPLIGASGDGSPMLAEMIDDSPHIALSAGPGAGKSTLAKLIIMQALRWGWGVVVLDWKQTEAYSWLGGMEGVTYLSKIEDIHDMGERIHREVDLRKSNGMAGKPKVLVVRDEWNVTADLLMAYWTDLRQMAEPEEKKVMPLKSPALRGYAVLDYAGREYGLFDLCIAQRFSARVFNGNADIRECFNIKLLSRYSEQTVKMLAPGIKPFPKKSNQPGRWTVVVADTATVIQVPLITNEQAREFASGGLPNPYSPLGLTQRPSFRDMDHGLGNPVGSDSGVDDQTSADVNWKTLSSMTEGLSHLGITLDILRNEVKRDSTFPPVRGGNQFKGYTYDPSEVLEWAKKRHARMAAERASK